MAALQPQPSRDLYALFRGVDLDALYRGGGKPKGQRVGRWITFGMEDPSGSIPLYWTDEDGEIMHVDNPAHPGYMIFASPDWDGKEQLRTQISRARDGEVADEVDPGSFDEHTSWTNVPAKDLEIWRSRVADFIRHVVSEHPQSTFGRADHGLGPASRPTSGSKLDHDDIETINRHRASIGGDPIDLGAGWTPPEIHDMAENIRTKGRTHNPGLKQRLMR